MMNTKLPIGIEDFEKIRKENFYYVDKTNLINDILHNWGEVNLFTRPRRFGKTLNMSMLKNFFEIGTDKSIFDGLAISKEKELCEQHMGKYPVVFISLKEVDGSSFEDAYNQLRDIIRTEAFRLDVIDDSVNIKDVERKSYRRIINEEDNDTDIKSSLKMFSRLLEKHYGQKVIILIDEYDVPLDKAYINGYYPQMIKLIRAMFSSALKTNSSLYFAVLTGGLRVSKESIFTGLNNFKVRTITDVQYDEYFGFTDNEVKKMLEYFRLESHYDEVKQWYDGYLFGQQKVYCPWDVINYCDDHLSKPNAKPKVYWLNTSSNEVIKRLINKTDNRSTVADVEKLIDGETINKSLNEQLTHSEIDDSVDNIWSLLYMTGYLTLASEYNGDTYTLKIPNQEVTQIFKQQVLEWFNTIVVQDKQQLEVVHSAFENGDVETIMEYINNKLLMSVSYYDAKESFYHGFLFALLAATKRWDIFSNDEVGNGRPDLIVEKPYGELGIVIEIKVVKDSKKLDEACQSAMKQIEDKDYTADFKEYNFSKILAYGIAFCGKKCKVIVK